jgi:Uma2 family endonuclease
MSAQTQLLSRPEVAYPDSDGQPMAENTLQFEWITTLKGNLEVLFLQNPNVFVAGDLFWYPVKGDNTLRVAPDVMVIFGRPKGYRGSYRQWEEGGIAPQVVFEVLSPGNTVSELLQKLRFYERYGVEECYYLDPEKGEVTGWLRQGEDLADIAEINGWVSPRLRIRFQVAAGEIVLFGPDGQPFRTWAELAQERDAERQRATAAEQRAERLAARLRALGVDPDSAGE